MLEVWAWIWRMAFWSFAGALMAVVAAARTMPDWSLGGVLDARLWRCIALAQTELWMMPVAGAAVGAALAAKAEGGKSPSAAGKLALWIASTAYLVSVVHVYRDTLVSQSGAGDWGTWLVAAALTGTGVVAYTVLVKVVRRLAATWQAPGWLEGIASGSVLGFVGALIVWLPVALWLNWPGAELSWHSWTLASAGTWLGHAWSSSEPWLYGWLLLMTISGAAGGGYLGRRHERALRVDALIERAEHFRERGDVEGEIADWNAVIALQPGQPLWYVNRARAYRAKGEVERAIVDLDRAIALEPKHGFAHATRGEIYEARGDVDRAIQAFDHAIVSNNDSSYFFGLRGDAWRKKGDHARALADLNRAVTLDDIATFPLMQRARLLHTMERLDDAIGDWTKGIEILARTTERDEEGCAEFYAGRAAAYAIKGELGRALADWNHVIELDPKAVNALAARAVSYQRQEKLGEAIADWDRVIALDGNDAKAYELRGWAYHEQGELERAKADWRRAVEFGCKDEDVLKVLAERSAITS